MMYPHDLRANLTGIVGLASIYLAPVVALYGFTIVALFAGVALGSVGFAFVAFGMTLGEHSKHHLGTRELPPARVVDSR
jgi:hypothetical protein